MPRVVDPDAAAREAWALPARVPDEDERRVLRFPGAGRGRVLADAAYLAGRVPRAGRRPAAQDVRAADCAPPAGEQVLPAHHCGRCRDGHGE